MLQLNTLVRFIHSHSPARLSKFKKILARRPKSVPTPVIDHTINSVMRYRQSALRHRRLKKNCAQTIACERKR